MDLRFRGGLGLSPIGLENFRGGLSPSPSPTSAIASLDVDLDFGDLSRVSGWAPRATSAKSAKSTSPHCRTYTIRENARKKIEH